MKRALLLTSFGLFLLTSASAQEMQIQRLSAIDSDDGMESEIFIYNDDNTPQGYYHYIENDVSSSYYVEYAYDDQRRIIEDKTLQDIYGTGDINDMKTVCKCTYTYNEQGLLATRDNFNSAGSVLRQSAHIVYSYDDAGRLVTEEQFWANRPSSAFAIFKYYYDDKGLLIERKETTEDAFAQGSYIDSGKTIYTYDEEGTLLSTKYYYLSSDNVPKLSETEHLIYDEAGNIAKSERVTGSGVIKSRAIYSYDNSVEASQVVLPKSIEYELPHAKGIMTKRTQEEVWMIDNNTDKLALAYILEYYYEDVAASGLSQMIERQAMTYFDSESKCLHTTGRGNADVRVIGRNGATLYLTTTVNGRADLSSLAPGIYIVSIKHAGQNATYQKFVVR